MRSINLTIVMPTYNRANLLRDNIASLLSSNYCFELLVVDDGSTDGTSEVVKSFKDKRITILRNPSNMGYAKSLNEGIKYARNSQVLLCEDDVFIANPDEFLRVLLKEINHKTIVATHLLRNGCETKPILTERLKRFFAEPLAGEIYPYNGSERQTVMFCNNCFSFNRDELNTRFEESYFVGNVFRIESDFQLRSRKEGARITYNPKLVVDHRRYKKGGLRMNEENEFHYVCMINHAKLLRKHGQTWKIYFYLALWLLAHPTELYVVKNAFRAHLSC